MMIGGEVLPESMVHELRSYTSADLYNMYGPTEATVWSTLKRIGETETVTIGQPIANTRIYILDAHDRILPAGIAGELCIAGEGLARGYWQREQMSLEKFAADPFYPNEKMYRSGDYAIRLHNGEIRFLGRKDNQIKLRGLRIELGEIENALQMNSEVREAAVIVQKIGADEKLCAFFTAERKLQEAGLRQTLSSILPAYMIPAFFNQLTALPMTPNGKIDRTALKHAEESTPGPSGYILPSSKVEEDLVQMWEDILGVKVTDTTASFLIWAVTPF